VSARGAADARGARGRRGAAAIVAWIAGASIPALGAPPVVEMVAVVHVHTSLADGASSPAELARAARAAGVDALVVTDHLLERITYAPWPIGGLVGVAVSRPSVLRLGAGRYLSELAEAERATPGLVIVPGVEATPYARFSGSYLAGSLELAGWHRHLLVIGLSDPEALRRLPVAGNRGGGDYGPRSLAFLLPALAVAWAARRAVRPAWREVRIAGYVIRRRRAPVAALLAGGAGLLALAAGYPFRVERYSAVGPDPGSAPCELLVERARALGGVAVWAHPEARAEKEAVGIRAITEPYPEIAARTGADAFGALPQGARRLLPPGGLWDEALRDHLRGRRARPLFALAELDEHGAAGSIDFRLLQTVFQATSRTRAGLLEALREGRFYGRWTPAGRPPLRLARWGVAAGGREAGAAATLSASGPVRVSLRIEGGDGREVTARLVRDGALIWSRRAAPPFEAEVADDPPRPGFYRLDVEGAYPYRLISNPIFVRDDGEGRA
jgi:hypothetical protein